MPRRNGTRAADIETALQTLMAPKPPKASTKLSAAAVKAGYDGQDAGLFAVEMPKRDGVSVAYVAPQLDAKGKPTVDKAGGKSWRSAWFSLTVNSYRRDGDGPADAIALANALAGEPFVGYAGKAYLLVTGGMIADAKAALRK